MEKENKIPGEIKTSFSLRYLAITLLTALIMGGVSFVFSKFQQARPTREFTITQSGSVNLLNDEALPRDLIEVNYYLRGTTKKRIATLIRTGVSITNSGNEGAA